MPYTIHTIHFLCTTTHTILFLQLDIYLKIINKFLTQGHLIGWNIWKTNRVVSHDVDLYRKISSQDFVLSSSLLFFINLFNLFNQLWDSFKVLIELDSVFSVEVAAFARLAAVSEQVLRLEYCLVDILSGTEWCFEKAISGFGDINCKLPLPSDLHSEIFLERFPEFGGEPIGEQSEVFRDLLDLYISQSFLTTGIIKAILSLSVCARLYFTKTKSLWIGDTRTSCFDV